MLTHRVLYLPVVRGYGTHRKHYYIKTLVSVWTAPQFGTCFLPGIHNVAMVPGFANYKRIWTGIDGWESEDILAH